MGSEVKYNVWSERKNDILVILILMIFAWFINSPIELKGLYMDDLYLWSCYGEQSFLEYVFPIGGTRCRFAYYLAAWLEMALAGDYVSGFKMINVILNSFVAATIYKMAGKLSKERLVGFLCGFMYLLSRMSYYQISQVWGLMETLALWLAIGILYLLYQYLNQYRNQDTCFHWALVCYFTVCFVHERYMVLLPLFFLVLMMKKNRILMAWLKPVLCFLLVQGIRLLAIGRLSPAGTGGTDVADTFSIATALKYAVHQVAYVFGINAGPEHLNGQNVKDSPGWVLVCLLIANMALITLLILFIVHLVRSKKDRSGCLCNSVLFLTFIICCIVCSSVTIRLELRWVYVSFTAALLFLAYIYGVLSKEKKNPGRWLKILPFTGLVLVYVLAMIPVETHYRGQYPKLYYWSDQLRYNSLAKETYGKYGDGIFGKTIYIIGDNYEMSQFTADTFFKVFDKQRRAAETEVIHIDSYRDIGLVTEHMLVLREEPEHNGFQDVTGFIKNLKLNYSYGCYQDGWVDERASLCVMAGSEGIIQLEVTYPGNLLGGELLRMEYGDGNIKNWYLTGNVSKYQIQAEPFTFVPITFSANFYMPDAKEQRGENHLAFLLELQAD